MQKDYHPELIGFDDVAHHYLRKYADRATAELECFASQSLRLLEVIERACTSRIDGVLVSHQRRPFAKWPDAPKKVDDLLKPLVGRIAAAHSFDDDLHPLIRDTLFPVQGIGSLACYDIARRIGAWSRPKLEPTEVHLHRGTREGAKAVLLGRLANRDRVPMSEFPKGLWQSLTAAQMEDALCIYRGTLARIAGFGQVGTASRRAPHCVIAPAQTPRPGGRSCGG